MNELQNVANARQVTGTLVVSFLVWIVLDLILVQLFGFTFPSFFPFSLAIGSQEK